MKPTRPRERWDNAKDEKKAENVGVVNEKDGLAEKHEKGENSNCSQIKQVTYHHMID